MSSWNQNQNLNQNMFNPYAYPMAQPRMFNTPPPVYTAAPIHGKEAAWQFPMAANSEIYLPDADQDWIWWIRTDAQGNRTVDCFDVMPHVEPAPVDMNNILARLGAVEEWINGKQNKSNAKRSANANTVATEPASN